MASGSSEGTERRFQRPGSLAGERLPDASIVAGGDPGAITDSADATDGLGSVIFTKDERVDAGFFGMNLPPNDACNPNDRAGADLMSQTKAHRPTSPSRARFSAPPWRW
jgi:hypothetical protein